MGCVTSFLILAHMLSPLSGVLGDKGMLQYKRIFMFIPLSILLPALSVAILVLMFSRFGIATTAFSFLATSYIVGGALTFVVFWWFATGVNKKPYLHAFVMYVCSFLISTFVLMLFVGGGYISTNLAFDALISIMVMFVATKVGYKNKEVSSYVS